MVGTIWIEFFQKFYKKKMDSKIFRYMWAGLNFIMNREYDRRLKLHETIFYKLKSFSLKSVLFWKQKTDIFRALLFPQSEFGGTEVVV